MASASPMNAPDLLAHVRYQLVRHGWPAAAGLALFGVAAGLYVFGVQPAQARANELRAEQSALRQRGAPPPGQPELLRARQAALLDGLPAPTAALDTIASIHAAAAARGVELARGEYRLVREAGASLARYQLVLPTRSTYPALRGWLADSLNTNPHASLDDITLRREDAGVGTVEARVRITLYLRAD